MDGATHFLRESQVWKRHLGINPGGDQSLRRMLQCWGTSSPRHRSVGLGVEAVETFLADHVDRDPAFQLMDLECIELVLQYFEHL